MLHPSSPSGWLRFLGLAHAGAGLVVYRRPLADIVEDKVVDSVPDWGDRATAFWFLTSAPVLWLAGRLLQSAEATHDLAAQRAAGGVLTATGLVGAAAMPRSGFLAVAAVGIGALRSSIRCSHACPAVPDHAGGHAVMRVPIGRRTPPVVRGLGLRAWSLLG